MSEKRSWIDIGLDVLKALLGFFSGQRRNDTQQQGRDQQVAADLKQVVETQKKVDAVTALPHDDKATEDKLEGGRF